MWFFLTVQESPVKTDGRNLTGNPRKVRDSAAEIHHLIQEWNKNLISGSNVLSNLSGLKLAKMYVLNYYNVHKYKI